MDHDTSIKFGKEKRSLEKANFRGLHSGLFCYWELTFWLVMDYYGYYDNKGSLWRRIKKGEENSFIKACEVFCCCCWFFSLWIKLEKGLAWFFGESRHQVVNNNKSKNQDCLIRIITVCWILSTDREVVWGEQAGCIIDGIPRYEKKIHIP